MTTIPNAESCQSLAAELHQILMDVDKKWRSLEKSVEDVEERTLQNHTADLEKWFGSESAKSLEDWSSGGLRRKTRDRVQKLLLGPLTERMRGISLMPAESTEASSTTSEATPEDASHPIDVLLEQWELLVQQKLDNSIKQDGRHARKIARLDKVRASADLKLEQQKRGSVWFGMDATLIAVQGPVRALAELMAKSLDADAIKRNIAAVPAIVARSVCDWHFQRCIGEFTQLNNWWQGARSSFQRRPQLWERLMEKDGLFVNRIDRGIDEIETEKQRYITFANFGHSGTTLTTTNGAWPVEAASLLAHAVKEMRRRLRPIRDAAAWHVIDSAKAIQKELLEEEKCKERSPWEQVTDGEGMTMLCRALEIRSLPTIDDWKSHLAAPVTFEHVDPEDAAVQFSNVLDHLAGVVADIGKFVEDEGIPDTGGLSYILEEVSQGISYVHEDLLAVLDDATPDSLRDWLRTWGKWGDAQAGARLGAAMTAMPMKADSSLRHERRQTRRSKLAAIRGLQALLDRTAFRTFLLYLAVTPSNDISDKDRILCAETEIVVKEDVLEIVDVDCLSFCESQPPASPRSSYVSRKPHYQHLEESVLAESQESQSGNLQELPTSKQCEKVASSTKLGQVASEMPRSEMVGQTTCSVNAASPAQDADTVSSPRQVQPFRPKNKPETATRPSRKKDIHNAEGKAATGKPPNGGPSGYPPTPGRATSSRPVTPSWLEPPWPRSAQEVPFNSWTRPGTPSTVCDEADLVMATPKSKLVDGHCFALRPTSSCKRLPPLNSPLVGKSAW